VKRFVGEPIEPLTETADTRRLARGEPGLPRRFRWRGEEHEVAEVLEAWKQTGGCRHASGEQYVRKHWYRVRTAAGAEMTLYFERQPRSARQRAVRWWLHAVAEPAGPWPP
jgi:phosphoribosylglycinamide formyltransferase-1